MLHAEVVGSGARVVLVHGFTQTRRSWGRVAERLTERFELVLVDAPGHGRSGEVAVDLWEGGRMIGALGGQASYLGYSMGGRFCLHTALAMPDLVQRLVLVGATAGIEDAAARAERREADERLAHTVLADGVERFVDHWLARPLFHGLDAEAAGREARLENRPAGLAESLRRAGTGQQKPLWGRLSELAMPVLLVVGERDEKFGAVATRMADEIGTNATVAVIADAGHAAHLERPDDFVEVVTAFLRGGHQDHRPS
jgi:2-succinyl-6-hydroxy-2,4-cyclohexadiene-1-carboxylate synthase